MDPVKPEIESEPAHLVIAASVAGTPIALLVATVTAPDGTAMRWHTTFRPKVPGCGWIYRRALDRITREFVDGLVRASAPPNTLRTSRQARRRDRPASATRDRDATRTISRTARIIVDFRC